MDTLNIWDTITLPTFNPQDRFTQPGLPNGNLRLVATEMMDQTSKVNVVASLRDGIERHRFFTQPVSVGGPTELNAWGLVYAAVMTFGSSIEQYCAFFATMFEDGYELSLGDVVLDNPDVITYSFAEMETYFASSGKAPGDIIPQKQGTSGDLKGTLGAASAVFYGQEENNDTTAVPLLYYRKRSTDWFNIALKSEQKKCTLISNDTTDVYQLWGKWSELHAEGWLRDSLIPGLGGNNSWAIKCVLPIVAEYSMVDLPLDIGETPVYQVIHHRIRASFDSVAIYTPDLLSQIRLNALNERSTIVDQSKVMAVPGKATLTLQESTAYVIDLRESEFITETLWAMAILTVCIFVSSSVNSLMIAGHIMIESPPFMILIVAKAMISTNYYLSLVAAIEGTSRGDFTSGIFRYMVILVVVRNANVVMLFLFRLLSVISVGAESIFLGKNATRSLPDITSIDLNVISALFGLIWFFIGPRPDLQGKQGMLTQGGSENSITLYMLCGLALVTLKIFKLIFHFVRPQATKNVIPSLQRHVSSRFLNVVTPFLPMRNVAGVTVNTVDTAIWPIFQLVYGLERSDLFSKQANTDTIARVTLNGKVELVPDDDAGALTEIGATTFRTSKLDPDCYKFE